MEINVIFRQHNHWIFFGWTIRNHWILWSRLRMLWNFQTVFFLRRWRFLENLYRIFVTPKFSPSNNSWRKGAPSIPDFSRDWFNFSQVSVVSIGTGKNCPISHKLIPFNSRGDEDVIDVTLHHACCCAVFYISASFLFKARWNLAIALQNPTSK